MAYRGGSARSLALIAGLSVPPTLGLAAQEARRGAIELVLGTRVLSKAWSPYDDQFLVGAAYRVRIGRLPFLIDGAFFVSLARRHYELGAPAQEAPGSTVVEFSEGIGKAWGAEGSTLSAFVAAGNSLVYADYGPPMAVTRASQFTFFSGYACGGVMRRIKGHVSLGIHARCTRTPPLTLLSQRVAASGFALGIPLGVAAGGR